MKKIIAFSGSNSSTSINQQLINIVSTYVSNAEVEVVDLRDFESPIYSSDLEKEKGIPIGIQNLFDLISTADGFIVSSPEHNGMVPAFFKNVIDWLSRMERKPFNNKPAVFLAASPGGRGGASVLGHLLSLMPFQGANVIGGHGIGKYHSKISEGKLIQGDDQDKLKALIVQLERAL